MTTTYPTTTKPLTIAQQQQYTAPNVGTAVGGFVNGINTSIYNNLIGGSGALPTSTTYQTQAYPNPYQSSLDKTASTYLGAGGIGVPTTTNSIQYPQQTSIFDAAKQFQTSGLIPQYQPVSGVNAGSIVNQTGLNQSYNPISGLNVNSILQQSGVQGNQPINTSSIFQSLGYDPKSNVQGITGLDDNYYNSLFGQASKRLQDQYFNNTDSVLAQRENQIKRRGLFGSGIGESATGDVYKNFGQQVSDLSASIAQQQAQNAYETAKFNNDVAFRNQANKQQLASFLTDTGFRNQQGSRELANFLLGANQSNIQTAFQNQDNQQQQRQQLADFLFNAGQFNTQTAFNNQQNQQALAQLLLGAAGDQARNTTDFQTKLFDSQAKVQQSENEQIGNILNSLQGTLGTELIDPETRDYFESLFGSVIGDKLGYTYSGAR